MNIISKARRLGLAMTGNLRVANKSHLTPKELNHLLVSAMFACEDMAFLNLYETGLDKEKVELMVHEYWQIYDRDAAMEILNHLLKRNRSHNLNVLYDAYEVADYADFMKFRLHEDDEEIVMEYIKYFDRLKELGPELLEKKVFDNYEEMKKVQDIGWNLAQGAFLARACFEMGYLEKSDLKNLLERFYNELKTRCDTWKEYTQSYILGRSLEGWENNARMLIKAEKLLTASNSPLKGKDKIV